MKVILFEPQIPQNTGNVVRTCSCTGLDLALVEPLGFSLSDRWLKRAGLDYWEGVQLETIDDLYSYLEKEMRPFVFFSSKVKRLYTEEAYTKEHLLIFGAETHGLPEKFFLKWPERFVKIPMKDEARCLNLATSVGIGVYQAIGKVNEHFK